MLQLPDGVVLHERAALHQSVQVVEQLAPVTVAQGLGGLAAGLDRRGVVVAEDALHLGLGLQGVKEKMRDLLLFFLRMNYHLLIQNISIK